MRGRGVPRGWHVAVLLALLGAMTGAGVVAQTASDDPFNALPLSSGRPVDAQRPTVFPVPRSGAEAAPVSPLLTVDWDGLYQRSAWGQRVTREIAAAGGDLTRENNRVTEELTAEERDLTKRRAELAPADFRAAADAFDAKVVGIRRAQEAKSRAIAALADDERRAFITAALPLLDSVLEARGATAVIDARVIIRSLVSLDITDDLVAAADARLGDGAGRVEAAREAAGAGQDTGAAPSGTEPAGSDAAAPSSTTEQGADLPVPPAPDLPVEGAAEGGTP